MAYNRPIPQTTMKPHATTGLTALVQAEKLVQVAILLPSAAFIGWLFGALADHALGQKWMAIAGIVFGGASGLVYVIRLAVATMKETTSMDDTNQDEKKPDDQENETSGSKF